MRMAVTRNARFQPRQPKPRRIRGLGDVVAKVAEPIKRQALKHGPQWVKEALRNCRCEARREFLNRLVPLG